MTVKKLEAMATEGATEGVRVDTVRVSTWFGVVFAVSQVAVLVAFNVLVLPLVGSMSDPVVERGEAILEHADAYRVANYALMVAGLLLLGFLGAVQARLRRVDPAGVLATVAVAAGALVALIWPMGGMLHDVALEAAASGSDVRILVGWDAVAPFSLSLSILPRLFFVGAVLLGLRAAGAGRWLQRTGALVLVLSLVGSATLVVGALFPLLLLSTVAFQIWVGAVAWHWLRRS